MKNRNVRYAAKAFTDWAGTKREQTMLYQLTMDEQGWLIIKLTDGVPRKTKKKGV